MENNIYAAPVADLETPVSIKTQAHFYVVSIKKFSVLFIATMGIYLVYWFYKNWSNYKKATNDSIWPVARAIFSIFFVHSLFEQVSYRKEKQDRDTEWDYKAGATMIVVLMIVQRLLDRFSMKEIGSPFTDIGSILAAFLMMPFFIKAQRMINLSEGDPHGEANKHFTAANIIWIILGVIFWTLALVGMFVPQTALQ